MNDDSALPGFAHRSVNYSRGIRHHPLSALEDESDFLVISRGGSDNLDEHWFADADGPMRIRLAEKRP